MRFRRIYFLFILTLSWACSTERNTSLSRGYHNMTAHYNVYFNGNESFKEGVKAIEDQNEDDYRQVLAVFPDSKSGSEAVALSQMERAIEKGTKLIKVHSIRKKPEKKRDEQSLKYKKFLSQNEFNKWVDNAYLLIGKSHFYKHDYYIAQQTFSYMFREFQEGPEWYEAEIWNARAAIELGDFAQAKIALENYNMEGKAPSRLYGFYAATYADFYMRQGAYAEAIPFMKDAVLGAWSKYYRRRFNFILAQLYQSQGQYAEAAKAYEAVIKSNPPYEMAFNAKVNRAGVLFEEGGLEAVKKEIARLLRDKRNAEYEDQIYYSLAMAYKAEEQEDLALDHFLLSIEKSIDNTYQKGMSFFELSEIYYDRPEYKPAFYYLDTAMVHLNENFPGYQVIQARHKSLRELVSNIDIVEREDSLLRVAAMTDQERQVLIEGIIENERLKREALKKKQEEGANSAQFLSESLTSSSSQEGGWYFYNQTSVSMGKLEFERLWGRRKLEDNWRRANKQAVMEDLSMDMENPDDMFQDGGELPMDTANAHQSLSPEGDLEKGKAVLGKEDYLKDVPLTPESQSIANKRIESALMNQGLIYKDEIENIPYAIDAFSAYVIRYPEGDFIEDAYMNLYLCFEMQGDGQKMAEIKEVLKSRFPEGEFTAYINDPDYFQKREARNKKIEALYQQSYHSYLFSEFDVPVALIEKVKRMDETHVLIPKFKLLAALSYAKVGNFDLFVKELKEIKKDFKDSEVEPMATKMLALYEQGRMPVKGAVRSNLISKRNEELAKEQKEWGQAKVSEQGARSYTIDHKAEHSLVILINPEADLNRLKFNVADYNFSKFLLNDYEMGKDQLPDGTPVFKVSGFNNRLEALDYFYALREREEIFQVADLQYKKMYVIHGKNMEYLLSSGDIQGYDVFFTENYLSAEAFKNLEQERRSAQEKLMKEDAEKQTTPEREADDALLQEVNLSEEIVPQAEKDIKEGASSLIEDKQHAKETEKSSAAITQKQEEVAEEKQTLSEEKHTKASEEEKAMESQGIVIEKTSSPFKYEEGAHNVVIVFKKGYINTERIGTVFKNFTKSNYGTKYQVEHHSFEEEYYYIIVKGFSDAKEAKVYLNKVKLNSFLMREISRTENYLWVMSDSNFSRLSNKDSFVLYQQFYTTEY